MDDENYPNFGNAFPTNETSSSASWNPALRPEHDDAPESDDDFFERYPTATPEKTRLRQAHPLAADPESSSLTPGSDETESPTRKNSISVERVVDLRKDDASLDTAQNVPSYHVEARGPQRSLPEEKPHTAQVDGDEAPEGVWDVEKPEVTNQPYSTASPAFTNENDAGKTSPDHSPEENYEHQASTADIEAALEQSATTPLLDDVAPLPTPGHPRGDPLANSYTAKSDFDWPTQQASEDMPARIDRSFTTNFADAAMPQEIEAQSKRPLSVDWHDAGNEDALDGIVQNEAPLGRVDEAQVKSAEAEPPDMLESDNELLLEDELLLEESSEDIKADASKLWGGAVDDDDDDDDGLLLDDSDGLEVLGDGEDDDGFWGNASTAVDNTSVQHNQYQQQAVIKETPNRQPNSVGTSENHIGRTAFQAVHGRSADTPQTGLYDVYNQPGAIQSSQPQKAQATQSFVSQAKGGYQSPYDLPMDVVVPKRRPAAPPAQTNLPSHVPPPRTSSYSSQSASQPASSARPPSASSISPPQSSHSAGSASAFNPAKAPSKPTGQGQSGFFADLPITTKPRVRAAGVYGPQSTQAPTPPPASLTALQQQTPNGIAQHLQPIQRPFAPVTAQQQQPDMYAGLRPPEKLALLPTEPSLLPSAQLRPSNMVNNPQRAFSADSTPALPTQPRYSPAPTAPVQAAAKSRYSPAPGAVPVQARNRYTTPSSIPPQAYQNAHPFAPRTSSPLAMHNEGPLQHNPVEASTLMPASPPKINNAGAMSPESLNSVSRYTPSGTISPKVEQSFGAANARYRTQSPVMTMHSASSDPSPHVNVPQTQSRPPAVPPKPKSIPSQVNLTAPQNETGLDPLERWKGHPIFYWSANGTVVSSFPKQVPLYAAGQQVPTFRCMPGAITTRDVSLLLPLDEADVKFPGPVTARSKGKKKDLITWMTTKIEALAQQTEGAILNFTLPSGVRQRAEEKLILWRIMKVYLENDGVLEGNPKIEKEIRRILVPNLPQMGQVAAMQSTESNGPMHRPIDKTVLLQLRQALLEGQRERAVWLAEENKVWGHAMLLASTMGPEVWKQIVQSFVRNQVKSFGPEARSIAALYQVFAGNSEECIDELVPPSARAGFQMVSKTNGSVALNPLEGLDQWRETLSLVASNRTPTDSASLVSLGKLLASYGRVEAAHTCYLFARMVAKQSGADDPEALYVLLGADHNVKDEDFGNDLDSILLSEIYEYASSLAAASAGVTYTPHLQSYKLFHAQLLASHGQTSKAQSYCDHITSAYTSTTRPSQYYHPIFTQSVAELSAFLSQVPHDGKSGFLSKPALNKVTSSAGNWFSKFVSGDDENEGSRSGPNSVNGDLSGPFGMVNGEDTTPTQPTSGSELYSPMMNIGVPVPGMSPTSAPQTFAPSSAPGRYAPSSPHVGPVGHKYATTSGLSAAFAERPRPSSARYMSTTSALSSSPQLGATGMVRPGSARVPSDSSRSYAPIPTGSRRSSAQEGTGYVPVPKKSRQDTDLDAMSVGSYEPKPILAEEPAYFGSLSQPTNIDAPAEQKSLTGDLSPAPESSTDEEQAGSTSNGGYEPPSGGFEPPSYSYQPYEPEPESPEEDKPKPKKKMFGDDDDDDADFQKRAATLKSSQSAAADRAADEAFRKAAEADAARDKDKGDPKKGWFGGWFGGKKDQNLAPGPIRAKLGEESSFVYDETLKKWVNKKAGAEAQTASTPTPPPPKASANRVSSAPTVMGPPSAPPARAANVAAINIARPPTSGSAAGPPSRTGTPASSSPALPSFMASGLPGTESGPPSRPSTGMSNANSLDDLLSGTPGPKKGGTLKGKKKGGRYVDVMAK